MKKLDSIINLVREIDSDLDKYEYNGYTYNEYADCKKHNIPGERSLKHMYRNNVHIWSTIADSGLTKSKSVINDLCRGIVNKKDIQDAIINLENGLDQFKKRTDDYSIYPIESESIGSNIQTIIKYFRSLIV